MSTSTLTPVTGTTNTAATDKYDIFEVGGYFYVARNGVYLRDRNNQARTFITRNAARKRISRERRGNFHA
jgi:hypothetical protein